MDRRSSGHTCTQRLLRPSSFSSPYILGRFNLFSMRITPKPPQFISCTRVHLCAKRHHQLNGGLIGFRLHTSSYPILAVHLLLFSFVLSSKRTILISATAFQQHSNYCSKFNGNSNLFIYFFINDNHFQLFLCAFAQYQFFFLSFSVHYIK